MLPLRRPQRQSVGCRACTLATSTADGASDILFRNARPGLLATWQLSNTAITGGGTIGNPGAGWSQVGLGDINGDGTADVVFRNVSGMLAAWTISGSAITGGGDIGDPGAAWAVAGMGDFNGDGKSDILFRNIDGPLAHLGPQWNRTQIIGGGTDMGNPGPGWTWSRRSPTSTATARATSCSRTPPASTPPGR